MQTLTIRHIPAQSADTGARVSVSHLSRPNGAAITHECAFTFFMSGDERRDIQWYLEEYLQLPWGPFKDRAQRVEELLLQKGEELFEAVFTDAKTSQLYHRTADHLSDTRIIIQTEENDLEGIAIPWELMRDPGRKTNGNLARYAHAFVRSQSDLDFLMPDREPTDTFNILMVISRPTREGGKSDPVLFFSFERHLPPSQVYERIGQTFQPLLKSNNIEWEHQSAEAKRSLATQLLNQLPCLMIWDNFEPVHGFPTGSASD